ncbi:hypothetical protein ACLOJK_017594 [Asimina triloba]
MFAGDEEGGRSSPFHRRRPHLVVTGEDVYQTEDDTLNLLNGSDLASECSPEHIVAGSSEEDGAPYYVAPEGTSDISLHWWHSVKGVQVLRSGGAVVKSEFTSVYISLAHMYGGGDL